MACQDKPEWSCHQLQHQHKCGRGSIASPDWRRRRGVVEAAACLWSEAVERHGAEERGGGDDGRLDEVVVGGGCGGSMEGGEVAADPH